MLHWSEAAEACYLLNTALDWLAKGHLKAAKMNDFHHWFQVQVVMTTPRSYLGILGLSVRSASVKIT